MSAYSTLRITRERAISIVIEKLLSGIEDSDLEEMLEDILDSRLYKVQIVDNSEEDNDNDVI